MVEVKQGELLECGCRIRQLNFMRYAVKHCRLHEEAKEMQGLLKEALKAAGPIDEFPEDLFQRMKRIIKRVEA